mmetsp:Transcript_11227/g.29965  ORF Transcript_11227/g.29965 Transcript_11227/m.29965 type:complete len:233 (-) Transcript_11227:22-720(-)
MFGETRVLQDFVQAGKHDLQSVWVLADVSGQGCIERIHQLSILLLDERVVNHRQEADCGWLPGPSHREAQPDSEGEVVGLARWPPTHDGKQIPNTGKLLAPPTELPGARLCYQGWLLQMDEPADEGWPRLAQRPKFGLQALGPNGEVDTADGCIAAARLRNATCIAKVGRAAITNGMAFTVGAMVVSSPSTSLPQHSPSQACSTTRTLAVGKQRSHAVEQFEAMHVQAMRSA